MNRIHRTVWNARLGAFVAVSEISRNKGRPAGGGVVGAAVALALLSAASAEAAGPTPVLPTGGVVRAGSASLSSTGHTLTVTQQSQRAAINWQSFSIGKDAQVNFVQPNAAAVALNRVTGTEQSVIAGALKANGQVFLLNPNGVLFTAGSRVDTAGLVASTRNLSDADFMAGRTTFAGEGRGDVVNQGHLQAAEGGYVALIGRQVRNDGIVTARLGTVALAAGDKVSLNFDGVSLVGVTIESGTLDALVRNGGAVIADGGTVLLKARAAEALLDTVVNNTGEVRARSVGEREGKVYLLGEGGTVEVAGRLDASNTGPGHGGFIETSGPNVVVRPGAEVSTAAAQGRSGTWLIDPTDFEIGAGTAASSASGIGATTLQNALAAGNVTIQTQSTGAGAGDINVNAPVAWNANKLTLEAHGDINVNAVMSATGSSTLDLKTGYNFNVGSPVFDLTKTVRTKWQVDGSGNPTFVGRIDIDRTGTGILTINNAGYTLINALGASGSTTGTDLQGINGNLSGRYALAADIDASASAGFSNWGSGNGFNPIGRNTGFTGVLDGLGHVVSGYNLIASANNLGLVGQLNGAGAAVRNIGVTNMQVGGDSPPNFGGLVGLLNAGSVSNAFATGSMAAWAPQSGGLVGLAAAGTSVSRSYAKVVITNGAGDAGGLIGRAETGAIIRDSSTTFDLESPYGDNAGGLVGTAAGATIIDSSASGRLVGVNNVGGLIGKMEGVTTVTSTSASGTISGANNVGGLIGNFSAGGSSASVVSASSATGSISASNSTVGGFIGVVDGSGSAVRPQITTSYAAGGTVSGPGQVGGLVGYFNVANLYDSYADMTVTATQSGAFWFGGLFSRARNMIVERSYALGDLDLSAGTGRYIGGFIGETINGTLTDVYARGNVNAPNGRWIGGLVGFNSSSITHAYSTGQVIGTTNVGGLVGASAGGAVNDSFWDVQTSGIGTAGSTTGSAGGTGRNTADMTTTGTFTNAGWNFASVWARRDDVNDRYPTFRTFGYVERVGTILIDNGWLAGTGSSPVIYSTSGLLGGDTMTLSDAGGVLSYTLTLTSGAGNYDGFVVAARNTTGDLTINRAVTWNNFKLDLEAAGHVNINAVLTATGTAQLDMKSGFNFNRQAPSFASGYRVNMAMDTAHAFTGRVDIDRAGAGILTINNEGYTLVNQLGNAGDQLSPNGTLQGLDVFTNYALSSHIDASSTAGWNSGAGFVPIADNYYPYVGKFEGLGHAITGLTINQPAQRHVALYQVGLFGLVDNASFTNLALQNVDILGPGQVGGLFGATINNPSTIANVTVSGTVTATNSAGGTGSLVGGVVGAINNANTVVDNVHATATVTASNDRAGGLVGTSDNARISASSSTGNVSGTAYTGGLVGAASGGSITSSTSSGTVTGAGGTGGLVGTGLNGLVVADSTSSANVTGQNGVGGLVGILDSQSLGNSITGSSATGTVTGNENVGGLLGDSPYSGTTIDRSFATGSVTGVRFVGGFLGSGNAIVTDAYATGDVTATDATFGYAGGFTGGGFGTVVLNRVYASGVVSAVDLGISTGSGGLSGFGFYSVNNSFYDATKNPNGAATNYGVGKTTAEMHDTATFLAAGWDFTFGSGIWGRKDSLNNGYPVLRVFGFVDALTVTLGVTGRAYGDLNPSLAGLSITGCPVSNCAGVITGLSWGTALDSTTPVGSYQLSGNNVLNYTFANGLSLADFEINYVVPAFDITPRTLSVATVAGATRVYDGTATAAAGLFTLGNVVNGDTVTLGGNALLDSVHAGSRGVASTGGLTIGNANYQLPVAATGTVDVTPRDITLATVAGATRVYDGTTAADAALFALQNVVTGDSVGLSGAAVLDSRHAGTRAVAGNGSLAIDNADYALSTSPVTGTVDVTPRDITLATVAGATRVYDGTTAADAALLALQNVVTGDSVGLSGAAVLDNPQTGSRSVAGNGSLALDNADYVLSPSTVAGTIAVTPRALDVSLIGGATRVFDGTADAAASLFTFSGLLDGDTASLSGNAVLDSARVGERSVVGFGTLALSNGDYQLGDQLPTGSLQVTPVASTGLLPVEASVLVSEISTAQRTVVMPPVPVRPAEAGAAPSVSATSPNVTSPPPSLTATLGEGVPLVVLSAPREDEPTEGVTLAQARRMVAASTTGGSRDVRVPVSRNSLAEIVNGGVRLPGGVEQMLFVVKAAPK